MMRNIDGPIEGLWVLAFAVEKTELYVCKAPLLVKLHDKMMIPKHISELTCALLSLARRISDGTLGYQLLSILIVEAWKKAIASNDKREWLKAAHHTFP